MVTDFFAYLASEPSDRDHYRAPGSNQRVKIKKKFQRKARKAHKQCLEAIEAQGQRNCNEKWRKVFGTLFPATPITEQAQAATPTPKWARWDDTEQFIEDRFPVDIRYSLEIDCKVSQAGYRPSLLRDMLSRALPLMPKKRLDFSITECTVPEPFIVKWKVLNRGEEAERRNQIRGQIVGDEGYLKKTEHTKFRGEHVVECYAIKDGVVVAKDRIHVPISANES